MAVGCGNAFKTIEKQKMPDAKASQRGEFSIFSPMKLSLALISLLFIGCATSFDINKVDFSLEEKQHKVLPLKYYNQTNINQETAKKIMKSILAADSAFMGYYYINNDFERKDENLFLFKISVIDGTIGFVLNALGVPKARKYYNLKARVYLFNSQGDITGIYEKTGTIVKYVGFYYGHSVPKEEIGQKYNEMFKEIVDGIELDKDRVNHLLKLSGTLEDDKTAEVFTNIYKLVTW
jgi:hypothetical protein